MATAIMMMTASAAILVKTPSTRQMGAKNSVSIATLARKGGMPIFSVKAWYVPSQPAPPNQPSTFWAPCGHRIRASVSRRTSNPHAAAIMVMESMVSMNLKWLKKRPFYSMGRSFPGMEKAGEGGHFLPLRPLKSGWRVRYRGMEW